MFSLSVSTVSSSEKRLIAKGIQSETRVAAKERFWVVFLLALLAAANTLLSGYTIGYPSSALLDLENIAGNRSTFVSDSTTKNLFGAMAPIGGLVGGAVAGWFADNLGRKITLILTVIPNIIGWTLIGVSWWIYNVAAFGAVILLGRFISGVGMGWSMLIAPVYIGEISSPTIRGLLSSFPQTILNIGILLSYCVGMIPVLRFYHNAFIGAGISVIILLVTLWIPETPRFLLAKRKEDKALKTLKLLRGPSFDVASELKQIEMALQEKSNLSLKEFIYEMKERNVYLPFILMTFLMLFQQFSGVNAIVFYAGPVFKSIGFQSNPQLISFLAVGLPAVILTIFCALIVDRFGRKPLLILSAAVVSLSFVGLSVSVGLGNINTLSVVSVIVFEIGFSLGYGAIPWIMIAEMIPMSVRGILGGILCAVNWGSAAIVTGSFLYFKEEVGLDNAWRTFAGINILSVIFVAVFLPETKGKNLESIELELKHSYKLCSS